MSRFSLSTTLALFQSASGSDSDATNSSTSSSSAINNSSSSLSISPSINHNQPTQPPIARASTAASILFEQHNTNEQQFKFGGLKLQKPNISNHLLELQREIKEEEDEIFALINRSNCYTSFDDDDIINEDRLGRLTNTTATTLTNASFQQFSLTNDSKTNIKSSYDADYFLDDEDQGLGHDSDLVNDENTSRNHNTTNYLNDDIEDSSDRNISNNNYNYSSSHTRFSEDQDYFMCNRVSGQQQQQNQNKEEHSEQEGQEEHYLELDEHNDEERHHHEQQEQANQDDCLTELQQQHLEEYQRDLQQLTSNLPKPCVFFLEGNCRRSDCKYSHDLSSITCKYWIEGFCFKGDSCPFLHSFNQKCQITSILDDDIALSKEKLNPTFAIESEADFPSLPLDAPTITLSATPAADILNPDNLTKNIENQILSSNPAVVFKTTKKKRKKG